MCQPREVVDETHAHRRQSHRRLFAARCQNPSARHDIESSSGEDATPSKVVPQKWTLSPRPERLGTYQPHRVQCGFNISPQATSSLRVVVHGSFWLVISTTEDNRSLRPVPPFPERASSLWSEKRIEHGFRKPITSFQTARALQTPESGPLNVLALPLPSSPFPEPDEIQATRRQAHSLS